MTLAETLDRLTRRAWRPGEQSAHHVRVDICWLLAICMLLVATGIGLRDPWPADEPRFALVARDMVHSGQWLIPMIGGDTYADKPPLFFWLIASFYQLTDSLRVAFLLPSLLATMGSVVLIYDLGRRLWNREIGLTAALLLLGTVQFVWQGRQAQIDAMLCFWVVLGLYGLLRHLLLGPSWRWYCIGCAAAGFGIITKGVGFLPLLILIPYALLRDERWRPRPLIVGSRWRWALGLLAMLAAICVWFVPMVIASLTSPQLAAYRDEILFQQTIERYANGWHHLKPFWYFLVEVIPPLWLPASALLPWAIPGWRNALYARDLRIALLLSWVVLVLLFFSMSAGKRGVYILPALPALCLALAPLLLSLWTRRGIRRVFFGLALLVSGLCLAIATYAGITPVMRADVVVRYGIDPVGPMLCVGALGLAWCLVTGMRHAALAWGGVLLITLFTVGLWINPAMNAVRSSANFIQRVETSVDPTVELGLVAYSEGYLLKFTRPTVNFGHARWRQWQQETDDAAAWLVTATGRTLLVDEQSRQRCFAAASAHSIKDDIGETWYLVSGGVDSGCVQRGRVSAVLSYQPPSNNPR
jgi:4-amino-4-deoxy-L-arabinose transferase-like glycosyltransferase